MWYYKIKSNLALIDEAVSFYEHELEEAKEEANLKGSLVAASQKLSGYVEYRYGQLQDIEAMLRHINILIDEKEVQVYKSYNNGSAKLLTATEKSKFTKGDSQMIALRKFANDITYIRDKYIGLIKAFDIQNYQISNITRLKVAGVDDFAV